MRTSKIQNGRQGAPKWPTGSGKGSNPRLLAISSHFRKISFLIRALPLWEKVATEKKMEKMENGMENKGRNSGHYVVASRPPIGDRLQRRRSCQKTMTWTLDSPPLLKSLSFFLESKNDDFDSPPPFWHDVILFTVFFWGRPLVKSLCLPPIVMKRAAHKVSDHFSASNALLPDLKALFIAVDNAAVETIPNWFPLLIAANAKVGVCCMDFFKILPM